MEADVSSRVVALVLLKAADGVSVAGSTPTAANVSRFKPSAAASSNASQVLLRMGFEVHPAGPIALSIAGSRALFEATFGTRLERAGDDGDRAPAFTAVTPLIVPATLAPFVDRVVLPHPAEHHSS